MNTWETFITAIIFGLTAGVTPGPLMTLVISETIRHGHANGIKISLAPFITDLPIMLISVFILSKLAHLNLILGLVSLSGALYLAYLAYESIKIKSVHLSIPSSRNSIYKGIIANFLNPNPYIFFFSIGGPVILRSMKTNFLNGPLFVMIFLSLLVGINILIAALIHGTKSFIQRKTYVYIIRGLGIVLLIFAFFFFKESLQLLKIW